MKNCIKTNISQEAYVLKADMEGRPVHTAQHKTGQRYESFKTNNFFFLSFLLSTA